MKRIKQLIRIGATLALTGVVWSGPAEAREAGVTPQWTPLSAERLDSMRGGFVLPSGLVLSFGIERLATVNGEVVAALRVNIPDLGRITTEQAQALAQINQTRVLQVGQGETVLPGGNGGLVIQNSLDGQNIGALTTINVGVGTLGLFQDLNLASTLHDALIGAPTSP